jgi:hypothetical protein
MGVNEGVVSVTALFYAQKSRAGNPGAALKFEVRGVGPASRRFFA